MFFSSQPDTELPAIGDAIETSNGVETVTHIERDRWNTYRVNGHPVEVVRRAVAVNDMAWVNVPVYHRRGASIRAWMWNPVKVLNLGDTCLVLGSDGNQYEVPRYCLRGATIKKENTL